MYSDEQRKKMIAAVCDDIANGMSLRKSCAKRDFSINSIQNWLNDDADFLAQYTRAREAQADFYADEICEIADTEEDPNKARVRIDARKWVASKLKSKSYGDKVQADVSGALNINIVRFSDADSNAAE